MDCDEVRDSLVAFVAGDLTTGVAGPIANHLASCPACELECEEIRELAADLRHAHNSIRPLQAFEYPVSQYPPRSRWRRVWVLAGAVFALWTALLTTAMLWPSFAEHLTFLPVGQHLRSAAVSQPGTTTAYKATRHSLAEVPAEAISALMSLFGSSSHPSASSVATVPAELSRILPGIVDAQHASVQLIAVGPIVTATERQLQLTATADITSQAQAGMLPQRFDFLVTLSQPNGQWVVSSVSVVARQP